MNITRYINGVKLKKENKCYIVENQVIQKTIKAVNERINQEFRQKTYFSKSS